MDAFASPSIRLHPSLRRVLRGGEAALLTAMLALSFFSIPNPPDASLDASWQEMLIYARAQGLSFGRDLIFTWGPWGFLCNRYHLGSLEAAPILMWQTVGQFMIASSLIWLTRSVAVWRRLLFAASILAFHWLFLDVIYFTLIVLIGIAALMKPGASLSRLLGWTLVLGFLSQIKFSYLVISMAAALGAAICWQKRGPFRSALAVVGGFFFSVLASWIAAGQNLGNFWSYLRRSVEVASGYADSMGFDESRRVFCWGTALSVGCAIYVVRVWRTVSERAFAWGASGLLAFVMFVMWKESFTRADMVVLGGHVFGLFTLVLILAPVLPGLLFPGRRWHWFDGSFVFCLIGIAFFDPQYFLRSPEASWQRICGNAVALGRLGRLSGEWEQACVGARANNDLPAIRSAVGKSTADVYDYNTGALLLNRIDLHSRPIFQGYSVHTPSLEELNLRYYQSSRAPEFLLWNEERIDNRYPAQDDALIVVGLPGHFQPLFTERGYWLFQRDSPLSAARISMKKLVNRRVSLGEEIEIPAGQTAAIWLEADAVPTFIGRARALAYKPAIINIATSNAKGMASVWRLLPRTSGKGFLLFPNLSTGSEAASFLRGEARSWIQSFHFEAPNGEQRYWSHVDVRLSILPGLPLRLVPDISSLVKLGILDRPAMLITSKKQQDVIETTNGKALLLPASGEIVLALPPGARGLSFEFGLRPESYSVGRAAGVEFGVDAVGAEGQSVHLWQRYLDPLRQAPDRGTQRAEIRLPALNAIRVVLHTDVPLNKDNRWSESYISALHFTFPGEQ